jgi:hypothetical protein
MSYLIGTAEIPASTPGSAQLVVQSDEVKRRLEEAKRKLAEEEAAKGPSLFGLGFGTLVVLGVVGVVGFSAYQKQQKRKKPQTSGG